MFLIFGIWRETQAIAGVMLVGRLLHPLVLIYILCVMFLSDNDDAENNAEIGKSIDMVYTDNPLQKNDKSESAATNVETHNRFHEIEIENADLKLENANKTQENNGLKTTITDLKGENSILREEMKELKRKFEEDDKSVDL